MLAASRSCSRCPPISFPVDNSSRCFSCSSLVGVRNHSPKSNGFPNPPASIPRARPDCRPHAGWRARPPGPCRFVPFRTPVPNAEGPAIASDGPGPSFATGVSVSSERCLVGWTGVRSRSTKPPLDGSGTLVTSRSKSERAGVEAKTWSKTAADVEGPSHCVALKTINML